MTTTTTTTTVILSSVPMIVMAIKYNIWWTPPTHRSSTYRYHRSSRSGRLSSALSSSGTGMPSLSSSAPLLPPQQQQYRWLLSTTIRSAMAQMMDIPTNFANNSLPDGIDIDAIKRHCIRSIGIVVINQLDDCYANVLEGSSVIVANNQEDGCLLLTNNHVVSHSPIIDFIYKLDYDSDILYEEMGTVVYVEQCWDLALVRLNRMLPIFEPMPMPDESSTDGGSGGLDYGQPGAMYGHGQLAYNIHPGMVEQPSALVSSHFDHYYVGGTRFSEHLPIVAHSAVNIYGFSGCPLIDTDGQLSGLVWGGFIHKNFITFAIDYLAINDFIMRALEYEVSNIRFDRLWDQFSMHGSRNKQFALILAKHYNEFDSNSGWFTIEELLPESEPIDIVNQFVMLVNDQPFTDIETIRMTLEVDDDDDDSYPTIQLTLRPPMYAYSNQFDWKVNITSMSPEEEAFVF
ncbi:uncharacterized protein LOC128954972 [Oppia nitens]|uniref:uncharacterized protein LOC128954972 n=1 Tax=Oppia nitens TaxID=1686743 RepID=UPI0023DA60C5|nr:uncharacterized protein LOC128954972 [Oppia nitens]